MNIWKRLAKKLYSDGTMRENWFHDRSYKLEKALLLYGCHDQDDCAYYEDYDEDACTCGLTKILKGEL